MLILLVLSVSINYIDRGNLSVAAPFLANELLLSKTQLGKLFSAFFWSYAAFQLVAGWLVDRYDVRWVYGLGFLIWSLATSFTGLATSFATIFALRLLLGIGESVAYPSYSRIIAGSFPERHRGTAIALVDAGSKSGPALGILIGGLMINHYGWRAVRGARPRQPAVARAVGCVGSAPDNSRARKELRIARHFGDFAQA